MNGFRASLSEIAKMRAAVDAGRAGGAQIVVCPPATLLWGAADLLSGGALKLGAQDCHPADDGPHTGDISAPMLRDAGALYVIVGHSERRAGHHENDALVRAKAEAALRAGLCAILCVGETLAEREAGGAIDVVRAQLQGSLPEQATPDDLVVAYEPIWAIGSGRTATPEDVAQMHAAIRDTLAQVYGEAGERLRILYGGSVKPGNSEELLCLPNVDGALVGGASLKASEFIAIAATCA